MKGAAQQVHNVRKNPILTLSFLGAGRRFKRAAPFVFAIEGGVVIGGRRLNGEQLAILEQGEAVTVTAGDRGGRFLLVAGRPLAEPVARGGPFVMNTRREIQQAYADYSRGALQ